MKILVSSAEASSDQLLAQIIRQIHHQNPGAVVRGIGGPASRDAGMEILFEAEKLLAMGTSEVMTRMPSILRARKKLIHEAQAWKPDVLVVLDYPGFHFSLLQRLERFKFPKIYLIPPKIWVWRKARAQVLRDLVSEVLCIFPFEVPFFESCGVRARFVGNPLVEILPFDLSKASARAELGISTGDRLLALFPGSRPSEVVKHAPILLSVAQAYGERAAVGIPRVLAEHHALQGIFASFKEAGMSVHIGKQHELMRAGDIGILKSGTVTLEAGLLGLPHGVVYRASHISEWVFRNLIRYSGPVGLVNLVSSSDGGEPWRAPRSAAIFPELLGDECTQVAILAMLKEVASRAPEQISRMEYLRKQLQSPLIGKTPSETIVEAIFGAAGSRSI